VHVVVGVDPENRMYLLDLWRGQPVRRAGFCSRRLRPRSSSSSLGSRGGIVLPMMVTGLQSTNQVEEFSGMREVMSAPVGCRDIHGRMLARERVGYVKRRMR
jgi:hypothetical protein